MADPANSGGGGPSGTLSGSPTPSPEFKVPDGKVLVDANEWQQVPRMREQNVGYQRFHEAGSKFGLKKPEDFDRIGKLSGVLERRGLTMEQVVDLLGHEPESPEQAKAAGLNKDEMGKFLKEQGYLTKAEVDQQFTKRDAMSAHQKAQDAESKWIESKRAELLGENPTARERFLVENAVRAHLESKRGFYPEGHPLRDEALAPFDEKGLTPVWDELKATLARSDGADMAAAGAAVNKGGKSVAGAAGTSAPKKSTDEDDDPPIGSPEHTKRVERHAAQLAAQRKRGPTSAAGG